MTDWSVLDGLEALAPHTGPFPRAGFVRTWWHHRHHGDIIVKRSGAGALVVVHDQGVARLAGEADLTDYHSPLGSEVTAAVGEIVALLGGGTRIEFDSLPIEAAEPMVNAFGSAGVALAMRHHDAAMVLELPRDPEAYLMSLEGKQRHEVRRKHRRFTEEAGAPTLRRDPDGVARFAAMHRTAAGDKGGFMTTEMEHFFTSLVDQAGAVIDVLHDGAGEAVGAAFGFEDADTYYLYNSAFDQTRGALSPGIVLVTALIEAAIVSGRQRFDFLKGGEEYKVRLGARPRPLFLLEGST